MKNKDDSIDKLFNFLRINGGKIKRKIRTSITKSNIALFGKVPAVHFIILGSARSGSNLLYYMLKSHKNIQAYGEIFNIQSATATVLDQLFSNPQKYVEQLLDQRFAPTKKAFGLKLFYNQMTAEQVNCEFYSTYFIERKDVSDEEVEQIDSLKRYIQTNFDTTQAKLRVENIWPYFKENTKFKILHLKRQNRLKQYLSLCRAWQSNQWISHSTKKHQACNPIHLKYENCLGFFEKMNKWEAKYHQIFKNNDTHNISYEKLKQNPHKELEKIQLFLGLPIRKLPISLQKQRKEPISIAIENYEELKYEFKGTNYEHYFYE